MIRYEIDRALFGVGEARRHLIEVDPQAQVGAHDVRRSRRSSSSRESRRRQRALVALVSGN